MLNDLEKDLLQVLLNNEPLLAVIRKVFKLAIEANRPVVNEGDKNDLIGEKYRAYEVSKTILDAGFENLENYKNKKRSIETLNRAR